MPKNEKEIYSGQRTYDKDPYADVTKSTERRSYPSDKKGAPNGQDRRDIFQYDRRKSTITNVTKQATKPENRAVAQLSRKEAGVIRRTAAAELDGLISGIGTKIGSKLNAITPLAVIVANAPSTVSKLRSLYKSGKGKKPPTRAEGMRVLLDLPQEENEVVQHNKKQGTLKEL